MLFKVATTEWYRLINLPSFAKHKICYKMIIWYVVRIITNLCPHFNGGLVKPLLNVEHEWVITYHLLMRTQLFIHAFDLWKNALLYWFNFALIWTESLQVRLPYIYSNTIYATLSSRICLQVLFVTHNVNPSMLNCLGECQLNLRAGRVPRHWSTTFSFNRSCLSQWHNQLTVPIPCLQKTWVLFGDVDLNLAVTIQSRTVMCHYIGMHQTASGIVQRPRPMPPGVHLMWGQFYSPASLNQ